ncbi:Protein TPX2 [Morella rubra]|uniref:Protein TPX2 n=1 Tax=Morella rubra TaxID=262757 RepID=A0A6A1UH22_9ROSI|nr:Protein TPX2 [Morella rubra]
MEKNITHPRSALKFVKTSSQPAGSGSSPARGMGSPKSPSKDNTKLPQQIKLHTQERAIKRAMFNYEVATKLYLLEQQKKQAEKLQKMLIMKQMIEDEEIRLLRKEMIPRAQLMPFFDRPFFPQRSNRPLTVPREPSFHIMSSKCGSRISGSGIYDFRRSQGLNPIK